tara:strand:- start:164 stop:388 length:225 start_codon:yes stop_codon:yes gene_type:complete
MFSLFGGNQKKKKVELINKSEKKSINKVKSINFTESNINLLNKMLILLVNNSTILNLDNKTVKKINNIQKIINT